MSLVAFDEKVNGGLDANEIVEDTLIICRCRSGESVEIVDLSWS